MFFGNKQQNEQSAVANTNTGEAPGAFIFDVTAPEFEDRVLKASMQTPVIVDFWAPWCGPCKTLTPILEKVVNESKGEILLAKINVDDNPELAQAMRIQSLPTVYAFFGGRPVDAFQGALPESQIKAFAYKIIQAVREMQPDALDIPEALKSAAQALSAGDAATAQALYSRILAQDEQNADAYTGLVRTFIQTGQLDQAAALVDQAPAEIRKKSSFAEAKTALELAGNKPDTASAELEAKLQNDPDNHALRYDLAVSQFAEGRREEAIGNLLTIIEKDREWNEQAARQQLLKFFEAIGHADPLTIESRRKLSSILFS